MYYFGGFSFVIRIISFPRSIYLWFTYSVTKDLVYVIVPIDLEVCTFLELTKSGGQTKRTTDNHLKIPQEIMH